jgi:hypothetical protein
MNTPQSNGKCNWCGENDAAIPCGCGARSCNERLCASCAGKANPARRFVDSNERPVIVAPGETHGGYAAGLTAEQRRHIKAGTAYIVTRSSGRGGWKVAVQTTYKPYWYEPSAELLARLTHLETVTEHASNNAESQ